MNLRKDKIYRQALFLTNNMDKYKDDGYNIKYDINNNQLIVFYHNKEYNVKIIEDNNELYWHLEPYNNTYYTTLYDNGFDMILFAIKENETIYRKDDIND